MLTNCFRFAPRDSVPGLIAKICKYLKDHPGWSEEELEEQIKQFIGQTGVESFNGRTGAVVLNEKDVNNLKIASAYFAEGDETIDELDLLTLYNKGVRFVFTNWNSVTSGYDLAFVLDYFSGSNDVVYYPMTTGSGGGNIVSVNGKTGIVELSLSDILGDSGAQVKLCTATEFTSTTLAAWNAYYEEGYRIVGVVNDNATAVDYLYLLKQDKNNHHPIGLTTGSGAVASVNGKTGAVIVGEAGVVKKESDVNQYTQIFVDESEDYPPLDAGLLNGKAGKYYLFPRNLLDNSDFTNPVNQRRSTSYTPNGGPRYTIDRWIGLGNTAVYIGDGCIELAPQASSSRGLKQIVGNPRQLAGKTVTFAVKIKSTVGGTGIYINDGTEVGIGIATSGIYVFTKTISANVRTLSVQIGVGGTEDSARTAIEWAALYEGEYTAENLPPYAPKGYAAELTECQRYFYSTQGDYIIIGYGSATSETSFYATVNLPMPFVKKPVVTNTGSFAARGEGSGGRELTYVSCTVNGNMIYMNFTGTGFVAYKTYLLRTTGIVTFNAEL